MGMLLRQYHGAKKAEPKEAPKEQPKAKKASK